MTDEELFSPDDTTIRWFGPQLPARWVDPQAAWAPQHGEPTRVPIPVGQPCARCEEVFPVDGRGYTLPHVSSTEPTVMRPYHARCLWRMLGVEKYIGQT